MNTCAIMPLPVSPPAQIDAPSIRASTTNAIASLHTIHGAAPAVPDQDAYPVSRAIPRYPNRGTYAPRDVTVSADYVVDARGVVTDIVIAGSTRRGFGFERSVRDALEATRYMPALRDGQAVGSRQRQQFVFQIESD